MNAPHLDHSQLADAFARNEERAHWHDGALWFVRQKRDRMARSLPEWETLRTLAAQIKAHTLANLPAYLEEFERNAIKLGAVVHWAADAEEHNEIVHRILAERGVKKVVKSKSMLTEECHLNKHLIERGMTVVDTDLGEWIVQLRDEPPSHIVLPAIHIKKEEVGETFHKHINTEAGASDPNYLTGQARHHLRGRFMDADAGITGVNFAIAENRWLCRLHQRRQCRPGCIIAEDTYRVHGHREVPATASRFGGVHAFAGTQCHWSTDYHIHVPFPWTATGL